MITGVKEKRLDYHKRVCSVSAAADAKCPECGKMFKTKHHLDNHVRGQHTILSCPHCGLECNKKAMSRHIRVKHKDLKSNIK